MIVCQQNRDGNYHNAEHSYKNDSERRRILEQDGSKEGVDKGGDIGTHDIRDHILAANETASAQRHQDTQGQADRHRNHGYQRTQ